MRLEDFLLQFLQKRLAKALFNGDKAENVDEHPIPA